MRQNGSIRGKAIYPEVRARFGLSGRYSGANFQAASSLYNVNGNVSIRVLTDDPEGLPGPSNVQLLMLGGGGGGGDANSAWEAGGAGAGGAIYAQAYPVATEQYTVVIGSGGNNAANGANTTIANATTGTILTALGGGHGASGGAGAGSGGCGGSGTHPGTAKGLGLQTTATTISADSRTYGFGQNGIDGTTSSGKGGGGTGGAPSGTTGGAGISVDITGANVNWGGGGGGTAATGGAGGGGSSGGAGAVNTGGGGCGAYGYGGGGAPGGAGGSGVAIIRFSNSYANATFSGANVEYFETGSNRIYKFNSGGTLTIVDEVGVPASASIGY